MTETTINLGCVKINIKRFQNQLVIQSIRQVRQIITLILLVRFYDRVYYKLLAIIINGRVERYGSG